MRTAAACHSERSEEFLRSCRARRYTSSIAQDDTLHSIDHYLASTCTEAVEV